MHVESKMTVGWFFDKKIIKMFDLVKVPLDIPGLN